MKTYSSASFQSRPSERGGISRLLTAAVVNRGFRCLLLTNPERALKKGYLGEHFRLNKEQKNLILSIRAETLADFASQIASYGN